MWDTPHFFLLNQMETKRYIKRRSSSAAMLLEIPPVPPATQPSRPALGRRSRQVFASLMDPSSVDTDSLVPISGQACQHPALSAFTFNLS